MRPALIVTDGTTPVTPDADTQEWAAVLEDRQVQRMEAHLVTNDVEYPEGGRTPGHWRGPYVERMSSDPWGARYAMNAAILRGTEPGLAIVVSPGPDGIIETPFHLRRLRLGGDDIAAVVSTRW